MHLNVWHVAASSKDSTDKLDSSRFILVSISEMSEVMPDALPHPLFLDVVDEEAIEETGEPLGSGPQVQETLEEITQRLMNYNRRVRETIHITPGMEQLGVCSPWLWRRSFCQGSWMGCPGGSACQLQVWLTHPPQLEREFLDDGQPPLGRLP